MLKYVKIIYLSDFLYWLQDDGSPFRLVFSISQHQPSANAKNAIWDSLDDRWYWRSCSPTPIPCHSKNLRSSMQWWIAAGKSKQLDTNTQSLVPRKGGHRWPVCSSAVRWGFYTPTSIKVILGIMVFKLFQIGFTKFTTIWIYMLIAKYLRRCICMTCVM